MINSLPARLRRRKPINYDRRPGNRRHRPPTFGGSNFGVSYVTDQSGTSK